MAELGQYRDGLREGIWTAFDREGNRYGELSLSNDLLSGPALFWHPNRELSSRGHYVLGKREGLLTTWYEDGTPEKEGAYCNGVECGEWAFWYDDGSIKTKGRFANGERTGVWTWFTPEGQVLRSRDFGTSGLEHPAAAEP